VLSKVCALVDTFVCIFLHSKLKGESDSLAFPCD